MTRPIVILIAALSLGALALAAENVSCPLGCRATSAAGHDAASHSSGEIGRLIAAAAEGATIEIGPGVYHEHLRIGKPITLVGRGGPIIDGDSSGDIVEIIAPGVTFRGFVVRNTGIDLEKENAAIRVLAPHTVLQDNVLEDILFGIDLREAHDCVIRGNRIGGKKLDIARRGDGLRLWRSNNTIVEDNAIHDGRDAILWYSSGIIVRNNTSDNCRYGLHLMYSDNVTLEGNRLTGNSVGIYLMYSTGVQLHHNWLVRNRGPSGYGIGLKETDRFSVTDNAITGNRVGVYIDGSPFTTAQPGVFARNTIACNDIGFTFLPSARGNELTENNFIDNIDQISVAGRGDLSANRFWKGERGNFWSDYTGYDRDNDGIGDFVHESRTLFENMMDKEPRLRLFLFCPAQQAIEFVGRAVPSVRPEPKFTDEVPLMRPVPLALAANLPRPPLWPLGATGLAMSALGAGVVGATLLRREPSGRHASQRSNRSATGDPA
jgi:nitrous oxidase accessory protein